ncbi:hypothetical protein PO909_026364 [Leuciscus waleckii]
MALLMEHQFRQLPADKQVETRPFLEAVSHLPPFFEFTLYHKKPCVWSTNIERSGGRAGIVRHCLGSAVFSPIKADIAGNITKIKAVYDSNPTKGLRFIQVLLQSLVDGDKDENNPNLIKVNITKAYEMALKKYHGWFVQKLFKAALYAAPYRSDFLKALSKGREVKDEECLDKVRQFLVNFTVTIDAIYEMYTRMNAELDYTV